MRSPTTHDHLYIFFHIPKTAGSTFNYHLVQNFAPDELLALYVRGEYYNVHLGQYAHFESQDDIIVYLESLSAAQRARIKVIYGHSVFRGVEEYFSRPARYITFMRETVSRTISRYNYCYELTRNLHTMHSWYQSGAFRSYWGSIRDQFHPPHGSISFREWSGTFTYHDTLQYLFVQGRFMNDELVDQQAAEDLCAQFYFVGLTERFDDDALFIYSLLGIRSFHRDQNISHKRHILQGEEEADAIRTKLPSDCMLYDHPKAHDERFRSTHPEYVRAVRRMRLRRLFYILVLQHLRRACESLYAISHRLKQRSRVYTRYIAFVKHWV